MKRAALIGTLVVSLVTGSAAIAGPGGRGYDDHREHARAHHSAHHDFRGARQDFRGERYDSRGDRHDWRWAPPARGVYRAPPRFGFYHQPHGYYTHRWVRGERLPVAYYGRPYVIADYRDCGLRAPPRGYHWVRVDGDAVLAAVATGIVLDTVFHIFD